MRSTINPSKTATVMILILSLLCANCNKKEEGKLTVTTKPVTDITTESAKCGGNVSSTGNFSVGNCGICWDTAPSPTIDNYFTTDNQGIGAYTSVLKHLSSGTKYYVRAYATTSSGIIYGEELDFTTEASPIATLTVYTNEVTEVTETTARCGGVVTANGDVTVTARGVCWSTSQYPTIENAHTIDGQGLGAFSSIMTQMAENTSYFVRAYATTESGVTYYGEEKSFTTESNGGGGGGTEVTVTVYTAEITEITSSTAKCGGVVTANGDVLIIDRGVCWSTSTEPSLTHHSSDGDGLGSFSSNVTGLDENTSYNIWAFATTESNVTYFGDKKTFYTTSEVINTISVVTREVSDITPTSAISGGEVSCIGSCTITSRGICWSTTHNPEISGAHTVDGQGIGTFISDMTELAPNTLYYVRAYATSDSDTTYGNEVSFTTLSETPSEIEVMEITYNSVRIRVSPAPNVAYYTAMVLGMGNAVEHSITETEIVFNDLSEQTQYTFEFSFYRSNGNLIDTDRIPATTLEKPYEYAYVTVTATDIQPGYIEIQFEPSPNTAYYCFNQGPTLTSTYQNTGTITKKYNYLQPDTEYIFSVVAYDSNGVAGEIIHPTFRTAPAPYSNYLRVANVFYEMNSAIIKTVDYNTGWGMKMLIIRGIPVDTYWIRLEYECYSSELNLIWNSGTYTIGGSSSHHQYNCRFKRNAGSGDGIPVTEGTFTISKSGNVYTIDIASEHDIVWAHFTGTVSN